MNVREKLELGSGIRQIIGYLSNLEGFPRKKNVGEIVGQLVLKKSHIFQVLLLYAQLIICKIL